MFVCYYRTTILICTAFFYFSFEKVNSEKEMVIDICILTGLYSWFSYAFLPSPQFHSPLSCSICILTLPPFPFSYAFLPSPQSPFSSFLLYMHTNPDPFHVFVCFSSFSTVSLLLFPALKAY